MKMPDNHSMRCVIVFLKVPQKSRVKTRLSKFLDPEIVVDIYKNFVAAQKQSIALNTAAYLSNIELDTNTSEPIE